LELPMNPFPAVLICGPPHSGKSVFTYLLSYLLRERKIEHYVLRACPDGEGDWSQEAAPEQVRLLRQKGAFDQTFVDRVCRDIERRHLPLLVDMGGRPTLDQERIIRHCTHAIVLSATTEGLLEWRNRVERYGLIVIAELFSVLNGNDQLEAETPVLRGVISGLERHTAQSGVVATALVNRLERLMHYDSKELKDHIFRQAPYEMVVDLSQLIQQLHPANANQNYLPEDLPNVLSQIPQNPVSIYGRGPNWLYAALTLHVAPHQVALFDPRLGWVKPLSLPCVSQLKPGIVDWQIRVEPTYTLLTARPTQPYLEYDELALLEVPALDSRRGVVISGKIPYWLLTSLVLAYQHHPWLAVVQPKLYPQAGVIVLSRQMQYIPGNRIEVLLD
jgi:CRISPR-associated protein Csx3